jgi:pimeloyl-ACP methyl ester carboxylesterase
VKWGAARASKTAAIRLTPLSVGVDLIGLAKNPWFVALVKAEKTGELLKEALARSNNRSFILVGHSLGARVAFRALTTLGTVKKGDRRSEIVAAHLLGGAVGSEPAEGWELATNGVDGSIFNYYSKRDQIVAKLYGAGRLLFCSPGIGSGPIPVNEKTESYIKNVDVSELVGGHTEYHEALRELLA